MRHVLAATILTVLTAFPVCADYRAECLAGIDRLRAGVNARPAQANVADLRCTLNRAERELAAREFDDCVTLLKRARVAKDDKGDKNDKDDKDDKGDGDDNMPETDEMFGFTKGSDIIEKGKVQISGEAVSAFDKRAGRYRAGGLIGSFEFAPVDRLSIEFGARGSAFSIRDVRDLDNRHSGSLSGFSTEIKWQAVKRGPSSPFGLTFVIEPDVTIRDEETGARGHGIGLQTRLALDTEIVPEKVFGAVNLLYELEKFRPRGLKAFNSEGELLGGTPSGPCPADADDAPETCVAFARRREAERSSLIGVSGALAFQAIPNLFVGAEARYMRSYEGLGLRRFEGQAVFIGPTFYAKLGKSIQISAAFSTQIAGRSEDTPNRRLDLDNFSRYQAKLKLSYEF